MKFNRDYVKICILCVLVSCVNLIFYFFYNRQKIYIIMLIIASIASTCAFVFLLLDKKYGHEDGDIGHGDGGIDTEQMGTGVFIPKKHERDDDKDNA